MNHKASLVFSFVVLPIPFLSPVANFYSLNSLVTLAGVFIEEYQLVFLQRKARCLVLPVFYRQIVMVGTVPSQNLSYPVGYAAVNMVVESCCVAPS